MEDGDTEKYHPSRVIQDFVFLSRKVVVSGVFLCRYVIKLSTTPDPGYQWESDKLTVDTTNESQEVSPFPAGDHKAHINRRAQNIANTRQNKNIRDPQKKYRLGTVSKIN